MSAGPIDAVFIDVGGPIYDDEDFFRAAVTATDQLRAEQGMPPVDRKAIRGLYNNVRNHGGSFRTAVATKFLGRASLRDALHECIREHWTHRQESLYADVLPLLSVLHGNVTIAVLANQEVAVVEALERDGVAPFVDIWGLSAIVGFEKPDVRLFSWVLARANIPAARALHIGNRLDNDVRPAAALGLQTAWILRGEAPDNPSAGERAEADLVSSDLSQIQAFLIESWQ